MLGRTRPRSRSAVLLRPVDPSKAGAGQSRPNPSLGSEGPWTPLWPCSLGCLRLVDCCHSRGLRTAEGRGPTGSRTQLCPGNPCRCLDQHTEAAPGPLPRPVRAARPSGCRRVPLSGLQGETRSREGQDPLQGSRRVLCGNECSHHIKPPLTPQPVNKTETNSGKLLAVRKHAAGRPPGLHGTCTSQPWPLSRRWVGWSHRALSLPRPTHTKAPLVQELTPPTWLMSGSRETTSPPALPTRGATIVAGTHLPRAHPALRAPVTMQTCRHMEQGEGDRLREPAASPDHHLDRACADRAARALRLSQDLE